MAVYSTYDAVVAKDDDCGINVILVAADAVVANEAVDGVKVIDVAADAVIEYDADVAIDAVATVHVLACVELLTVPVGNPVGNTYDAVTA